MSAEEKKTYEQQIKRINRAVEYVRAHQYPANIVYGIVAAEQLKLRIKIWDKDLQGEELESTLKELSEFVHFSARESLSLPAVETYIYSRGGAFELVTADNEEIGVIDPSTLVTNNNSAQDDEVASGQG